MSNPRVKRASEVRGKCDVYSGPDRCVLRPGTRQVCPQSLHQPLTCRPERGKFLHGKLVR